MFGLVGGVSALVALASDLVDKPSGRSYVERFLSFFVVLTVLFLVMVIAEDRRRSNSKSVGRDDKH